MKRETRFALIVAVIMGIVCLATGKFNTAPTPTVAAPAPVVEAATTDNDEVLSVTEMRDASVKYLCQIFRLTYHKDEWDTAVNFNNDPHYRIMEVTLIPDLARWYVVFDLDGNIKHVEPINTTARMRMGME